MKPKRPSETDLLALVQQGFNSQFPKDRATQPPAQETQPQAAAKDGTEAGPVPLQPMARITITIPEELRYRLKLLLMDYRRHGLGKLTQDDYCVQAISGLLDIDEDKAANPWIHFELLAVFIQSCLEDGGFSKAWAPRARIQLEEATETLRSRGRPSPVGRGRTGSAPRTPLSGH